MDYLNINLDSPYESEKDILDGYSFDILLLEVQCNVKTITNETVKAQAMDSINSKYQTAIEILNANLDNITAHALNDRNKP